MNNDAKHHSDGAQPESKGVSCDATGKTSEDLRLDDLLASFAASRTLPDSPWFAARTAAKARELPQGFGWLSVERFSFPKSHLVRWMLPLPLAGVAAALLILHSPLGAHFRSFHSSESDFEQDIVLVASNGYSGDYFAPESGQ